MEQSLYWRGFRSVFVSLAAGTVQLVYNNRRINGMGDRTFLQIVRLAGLRMRNSKGFGLRFVGKCAVENGMRHGFGVVRGHGWASPPLKIQGVRLQGSPVDGCKMGRFSINALLGGDRGGFFHG